MTPLEEQLEKLARRWEKEADEGELLDEVAYALEGAADELRALLPLEVTDESVTVTLSREEIEAIFEAMSPGYSSEIQRYKLGGGSISEQDDGAYVLFTDHDVAIALRTRVCAEAFEDELARTEERVLADAKARIEEINIEHHVMPHRHDDYALFEVALNCALAALTQKGDNE